MAKQIWKPATILNPVPVVLVTSSYGENDNVFTVAWTGTFCSDLVSIPFPYFSEKYIPSYPDFFHHLQTQVPPFGEPYDNVLYTVAYLSSSIMPKR